MWLNVLESLGEALEQSGALAGAAVQIGGQSCGSYPCVQLLRGNMTGLAGHGTTLSGIYTFYIDLWVQGEEPAPKQGYEKLNRLEKAVLPVIREWLGSIRRTPHLAANAQIVEIAGDEEKLRPLVKNRYTVKMQFRKEN